MPKNSAPTKNKAPVKIFRSRTATAQMRNQVFHQSFDYLREITERIEAPMTSTGRGKLDEKYNNFQYVFALKVFIKSALTKSECKERSPFTSRYSILILFQLL